MATIEQFASLGYEKERRRRIAMASEPHVCPLGEIVSLIRKERDIDREVPDFDPCDGGINAKALILLEAPGPKAVCSSFISRDNPDSTAKNVRQLFCDAGIDRRDTVLWNIVPWYIGDGENIGKTKPADIAAGIRYLKPVIDQLGELRAIVLVGKAAQSAKSEIPTSPEVKFLLSPHPSQRSFNARPELREKAVKAFQDLADLLR